MRSVAALVLGSLVASGCASGAFEPRDHGPVVSVATGTADTCIVHADGTVGCRGSIFDIYGERPPAEPLHDVAGDDCNAYVGKMCGLTEDGNISCWGFFSNTSGVREIPDGVYSVPSTCLGTGVALDVSGGMAVWGIGSDLVRPTEALVDVAIDWGGVCGITTKGEVQCNNATATFAWDLVGPPDADPLVSITGQSGAGFCALNEAGKVLCMNGDVPADLGEVVKVAGAAGGACVLQVDGGVRCFGLQDYAYVTDVPSGPFIDMDAGETHACAVRDDGEVVCWGEPTLESRVDATELSGEFKYAYEAY